MIMRRMINNKIFSLIKQIKKLDCVIYSKHRKFEKPKISYILEKTFYYFLLFTVSVKIKLKKIFKEEESIEILKILGSIQNI